MVRFSTDPDDAGFMPYYTTLRHEQRRGLIVHCDGILISSVITADEEMGLVIATRREGDSRPRYTLNGVVTIDYPGREYPNGQV